MTLNFRFLSLGVGLFAVSVLSAQEPSAVRTVLPTPAGQTANYAFPGRTEPFESARMFSRATGIIRERLVDIGDHVKKGDILAVIDAPDLDREVDSARAAVEQATVRAANAHAQARRAEGLLAARAISQEDADRRIADAAAAAAAERVARADLARLEELQRFAVVRAPFDALIAARNFDRGDRVRGDSTTAEGWLFHVVRLDVLRFAVQVAPEVALRLDKETEATVRFNELPGRAFTSKVVRSSRVFDTATGTMRVELQLPNPDLSLPAGLTGTAVFSVSPASGTFLVPTNTLVTRSGQAALVVVDGDKVVFIDVKVGRNLGAQVEVSGAKLSGSTRVIVNPNALLREGDVVAVTKPEKTTPLLP